MRRSAGRRWHSFKSDFIAGHPFCVRPSTLSIIPCDTWNRDTSGSAGEFCSRSNVA